MPALVMALVTTLGIGFLVYDGTQDIAVLGVVGALGAIGIGLIFWARSGAAADAGRLRATANVRETRLGSLQAEIERLRDDLVQASARQRETDEQARSVAATAAERQKQHESALRENRAELERMRRELDHARRKAADAAVAAATTPPGAPAGPAPSPATRPTPPSVPAATSPGPPKPAATPAPPPAPPKPAPAPTAPPKPAASPVPPPAPPKPAPAPVVERPASEPALAAPPIGTREPDPPPGSAVGTVLLVDDDPSFLFVAANILRPAGFRVIEAESGQAALDQAGAQAAQIDLLVTDMMMAGMNGRQLAQRFTKLRPGVRVLYVSGIVDEGSAREAIEGEEADFLAKPFAADAFVTKVRELSRARR
jgi:CheY-like chemotaxis protein